MTADEGETPAARRISGRRLAWILVSVMCSASLVLSAFSVDSYTDIAEAKILSYVETGETVTLGFDGGGSLESVNLTIGFRVVNPSDREIRAWIFTYKGWVRDLPMEDGTDTSRWMVDGRLDFNGTEMRYYPVFVSTYSMDYPPVIVPANSEITVTRQIEVNSGNYPDILADIAKIWSYAEANGHELEWLHFTSAILFVEGIPQFSGPNNDANLIKRYEGFDLTPGVGGAS